MRKYFRWLFTAAALLLLAGCDKDDKNGSNPEPPVFKGYEYTGTVEVDQQDGTTYPCPDVVVQVSPQTDGTVQMKMLQVRFSENMPLKLDMTVSGIGYTADGEDIVLHGNNIIPEAMGGPFPAYTITDLVATGDKRAFTLSMTCGGKFPLRYTGTAKN